jgi:hypothetical protein
MVPLGRITVLWDVGEYRENPTLGRRLGLCARGYRKKTAQSRDLALHLATDFMGAPVREFEKMSLEEVLTADHPRPNIEMADNQLGLFFSRTLMMTYGESFKPAVIMR